MALSPSSLSHACRSIATFVQTELGGATAPVEVIIGNPYDAANATTDGSHRLNLFFYRFDPSGFQSSVLPGEPWLIRLHCLFTAFSIDEDNRSAGENDLRIVGEVMRVFHESPILSEITVDDERVRLQAVYEPLSLDDLNHIWSTQNDVSFRPSISYELALAPVVPKERDTGAPLSTDFGVDVQPGVRPPVAFSGNLWGPEAAAMLVDIDRADWVPHIALVVGGEVVYAASFEIGSVELAAFTPRVWAVGEPGATLTFAWDTWTEDDGWTSTTPGVDMTLTGSTIDPATPPPMGDLAPVPLPFDDRRGQAVLRAHRSWARSDGSTVDIRSNSIVVNLWGGP